MLRNKETGELESKKYKRVGMIAAGTGIAPMFQLTQTVSAYTNDNTSLSLIFTNRSPYDVVLDEDLNEFEKMGKLFYFPVIQGSDDDWRHGEGRIS